MFLLNHYHLYIFKIKLISPPFQAESDCDDQTTDQALQAKMKNAFVSQNVSSLQELGV